MEPHLPRCDTVQHVDFGGYYLTHAIWRNCYGSHQPETGVRTHANGLKDFRLIQHNSDDWPMVTVITLAALSKGWNTERIADLISWLHHRRRKSATIKKFRKMHDDLVVALRA